MSLKETFAIQRNYFGEYGREIAVRNLKLMRTVCYCGILMFVVYYIFTYLFFPSEAISIIYGAIVPVLGLILLAIRRLLKEEHVLRKRAQLLTIVMYLLVLIYAIIMSVVPHPELQAVYYPLFLMLGPVMFILPLYQQILLNGGSYVVFVLSVLAIKPEACWMHDLFESATALIFSMVTILLMTQFRVQSDDLKNKYYKLSRFDGLTGLLNKTTGTVLARDYAESKTVQEPFALVILDVDDFKHINDTYGHEKGDVILAGVGRNLRQAFRKEDVICRFGGDEFMLLLKDITRPDVEQRMETLFGLFENEHEDDIRITCSAGVYQGICGREAWTEILQCADQALYEVKKHGKNRFVFSKEI